MIDDVSSNRAHTRVRPDSTWNSELELHRFGGLAGQRKRGLYKEVSLVDPFSGGVVLHFPSSLHADNWLVSCFTRSTACTVPHEPLQALDRGKLLTVRVALILKTPQGDVADCVVPVFDDKSRRAWDRFQIVTAAHNLRAQLRTREEIRAAPTLVRNLDRLRQQLVQANRDGNDVHSRAAVKRIVHERGCLSLAELVKFGRSESLTREAVESALIGLYRASEIEMNIAEAAYGDDTSIQLL